MNYNLETFLIYKNGIKLEHLFMKVICKIKYTINCKLIYLRKGNLLVYIKDDTAIVIEKGLSSLRYPESKKYTPAIGYV